MAREFTTTDEQTSAEPTVPATSDATETNATPDATQTSGEPGAATADSTPDKEAEPTVDVAALQTAFEEAVAQALLDEGRDEDTGTLPESALGIVRVAYSALPARGKTAARDFVQSEMTKAMVGDGVEQDFNKARSLIEILNALKTAPRATVVHEPVDPTVSHVDRVTALMLSPNLVLVPEGVAADWQAKVNAKASELGPQVIAYRNWLQANAGKPTEEQEAAPTVDDIVLAAAGVAKGRTAATRRGTSTGPRAPRAASTPGAPRRDIAAHITSAFAEVESGTFLSIGEIVKHKSAEYGDDAPSQGAVAARLFPNGDPSKCNVPGVKPEQRERKGAVKL